MREDNKRWLISRMKTSGSKRERVKNGNYADERHLTKNADPENLPQHEAIKSTRSFYNGKINYGLLVRFLRGQTGNDWDMIYSEIISRIPTKLLDYKEMIFWFVADKVEFIDGRPWNKKTQQFIWTGGNYKSAHHTAIKTEPELREFYVDPNTNTLVRIQQKSFKRLIKKKRLTFAKFLPFIYAQTFARGWHTMKCKSRFTLSWLPQRDLNSFEDQRAGRRNDYTDQVQSRR